MSKRGIIIDFKLTTEVQPDPKYSPMEIIIPSAIPHAAALKDVIPALQEALQLTHSCPTIFQDRMHNRVPKQLNGLVGIDDVEDSVMKAVGDVAQKFNLLCRGIDETVGTLPGISEPVNCRHLTMVLAA